MPRSGSKGRETYAAINEMVAKEGMPRSAAFARYGEQTDTRPGTVSANYYRIARAEGATSGRKPRRKQASPKAATPRPSAGRRRSAVSPTNSNGVEESARAVIDALNGLVQAVKAQNAEIEELRSRLDAARGLLG